MLLPGGLSSFWLFCICVSLAWHVFCIQRGAVILGLANFGLGFLPMWGRVYGARPAFYWSFVSLATVAVTVAML